MGKDYERLSHVASVEHGDDASDAAVIGWAEELLAGCQARLDLVMADPGFTGQARTAVVAWLGQR